MPPSLRERSGFLHSPSAIDMVFHSSFYSSVAAYFVLLSSLLLMPWVEADAVNRTIDDTFGDSVTKQKVVYVPTTGAWHDATCLSSSGCAIVADPSQCFSSTYTAATYRDPWTETSITMQFNGTAIYVFFILANNMGNGITTQTVTNFTLDDGQPQLYTHQPDPNTKDLNYGQLVYSKANLTSTQHTLVISASGIQVASYINFDYAIYTHEEDVQPSTQNVEQKKNTPVGAIVGGVIGGVAALLGLAALIFFLVRRRRQNPEGKHSEAGAFNPEMMVEANPASLSQSPPRPSGSVDPFLTPQLSQGNPGPYPLTPVRSGIHSPQTSITTTSKVIPVRSPSDTVYGSIADHNSSNGRPDTDLSSSNSGQPYNSMRHLPLVSVTAGDHLSGPTSDFFITGGDKSIEAIRQVRQRELDQRLRSVQQEMAALASEIANDGATRQPSIPLYPSSRSWSGALPAANQTEGREMVQMKEQLQIMREQIDFLTAQQQSPWAQGLSDDPPPGYTTTSTSV